MAKRVTSKEKTKLFELIDDVIFKASARQRELKEAFWYEWNEGPQKRPPMLQDVVRVLNNTIVKTWWTQPGFKEWFLNSKTFDQRAAYLAERALDIVSEAMDSADNVSDKLKAAKMAIEVSGRMSKTAKAPKFLDKEVQEMNKEELELFIKQHTGTKIDKEETKH